MATPLGGTGLAGNEISVRNFRPLAADVDLEDVGLRRHEVSLAGRRRRDPTSAAGKADLISIAGRHQA